MPIGIRTFCFWYFSYPFSDRVRTIDGYFRSEDRVNGTTADRFRRKIHRCRYAKSAYNFGTIIIITRLTAVGVIESTGKFTDSNAPASGHTNYYGCVRAVKLDLRFLPAIVLSCLETKHVDRSIILFYYFWL